VDGKVGRRAPVYLVPRRGRTAGRRTEAKVAAARAHSSRRNAAGGEARSDRGSSEAPSLRMSSRGRGNSDPPALVEPPPVQNAGEWEAIDEAGAMPRDRFHSDRTTSGATSRHLSVRTNSSSPGTDSESFLSPHGPDLRHSSASPRHRDSPRTHRRTISSTFAGGVEPVRAPSASAPGSVIKRRVGTDPLGPNAGAASPPATSRPANSSRGLRRRKKTRMRKGPEPISVAFSTSATPSSVESTPLFLASDTRDRSASTTTSTPTLSEGFSESPPRLQPARTSNSLKQLSLPSPSGRDVDLDSLSPKSQSSDTREEAEDMKLSRKFRKLFSLNGQEALLHRLTLSMDVGRRHLHGRIFLGEEHVGIVSRMFSIEHKVAFHWAEVDAVIDPDATAAAAAAGPGRSPRSPGGSEEQHRKILLHMHPSSGLEDVTFILAQTEKSVTHQQLMVLCQGLQHKHMRRVESPPRVDAEPVFGSNPPSAHASRQGSRIKRVASTDRINRVLRREPSRPAITDQLTLTKWDWALLLEGATCREYQDGEVIVHEGQRSDSIFQIGAGICRVTSRGALVGMLANLEMFGEVSFLHPSGVSPYTVEAAGDGVQVYSMSRAWLDEQFVLDEHARLITLAGKHALHAGTVSTGLAGRFYKFLALTVARRIRQRELETVLSGPSDVDLGGNERIVSLSYLSEMTR